MAGLLVLTWLLHSFPSSAFDDGPSVLTEPAVLDCFVHLMREAKFGFINTERAAFLVQDDRGLRCLDWPATHDFKQAHWSGPVPRGVVALAHTHPFARPFASPDDIEEAKRIRLPIFVLAPNKVTVVHADGRTEILHDGAGWTHVSR